LSQTILPDWASEETLPKHVSIIMDGNGRWAKSHGEERSTGHKAGTEAARSIVREARKLGIRHLTLYTFSTENWSRPKNEVAYIFELLVTFLNKELPSLVEQGIRLVVLGDVDGLPLASRQALRHAMRKTAGNTDMTLNLALNYSSRDEIVRAVRRIVTDGLSAEEVTTEALSDRLWTAGQPDPDLMIRTSGEQRLSNYLLFQHAYSEFYFTKTYWPDFTPEEFHMALKQYTERQRRFGKTGEQVTT